MWGAGMDMGMGMGVLRIGQHHHRTLGRRRPVGAGTAAPGARAIEPDDVVAGMDRVVGLRGGRLRQRWQRRFADRGIVRGKHGRRRCPFIAGEGASAAGERAGAVAILLAPAIDQRLHHPADGGRMLDVVDGEHTRGQQRMDVPIAEIERHRERDRAAHLLGDQPPGRRLVDAGGSERSAATALRRLFHQQCLFEPIGGAAQAGQPLLSRGPQILGLVQGVVQPPNLHTQQRQLGTQTRDHLRPQALVIVPRRVPSLGPVARVLIARH